MNTLSITKSIAVVVALLAPGVATAQPFTVSWSAVVGGGAALQTGGPYTLRATIGQAAAGSANGGSFGLATGFQSGTGAPSCYANCDGSTQPPTLNVADFACYLQRYAGQDPYANCDGSTAIPTLNVADFTCFLQKYASGCP